MKKKYIIPTIDNQELRNICSLMSTSYADPQEESPGATEGGKQAPGRNVF